MDEDKSEINGHHFHQHEMKLAINEKSILTFGEPLIVFSNSSHEGIMYERQFQADVAGAELNTAVGLARLGVFATFSAAVGDDPFGAFILRELRAEGIDTTPVSLVQGASTGVFFKMPMGLDGDPRVEYYRSQSAMALGNYSAEECIPLINSGNVGWVHTTGITRMVSKSTRIETDRILKTAMDRRVVISFDINIRLKLGNLSLWRQNLQEVLPFTTWVFMGDSEAKQVYDTEDVTQVYEHILGSGFNGRGLVIKQGASGSTAITEEGIYHMEAFPIRHIVDTVGAGDGYNAGFIAGINAGWGIHQAMKLGSIIGAYAVSSRGDSSGYPSWNVVKKHLIKEMEVLR